MKDQKIKQLNPNGSGPARPLGNFPTQVQAEDKTFLLERKLPDRVRVYHLRIGLVPLDSLPIGAACPTCGGSFPGDRASLVFTDRGNLTACNPCAFELKERGVPSLAYVVEETKETKETKEGKEAEEPSPEAQEEPKE